MRSLLKWLREPEIIGAPDCPIMLRWTIFEAPPPDADESFFRSKTRALFCPSPRLCRDRKLMVHRFLPNVEDRDPHDHPRGFWTLVLWGRYYDLVPCRLCKGTGQHTGSNGIPMCSNCIGEGVVIGDVMKPGVLRHRRAEHTHITQSGPRGAWTIVLMTPFKRPWGFWRSGRWWAFKDYEAEFGFAMRCPTDEQLEDTMLKYTDAGVVVKGPQR